MHALKLLQQQYKSAYKSIHIYALYIYKNQD